MLVVDLVVYVNKYRITVDYRTYLKIFNMSGLKEEVEEATRKLLACYNAGNFIEMGKCYTEDIRFMAPGSPMVIGRDAAVKKRQADHEAGFKTVKPIVEEVGEAGGDVIYSRGVFTCYGADGKEKDTGKYVSLWKRVDGRLYFYTDISCSD
ncbi:hypothetical protein HOLleu_24721 [Holothuria leucospilota]|uniref:DUF4440 domain-containing protein n=1 Tax=Holothuria leucospilota TaxID=206669 RepID=A0A9Q1BRK8_HOLLE|nr:hypothetical protein HOLleu_24721 [Holothuria leucospilota]